MLKERSRNCERLVRGEVCSCLVTVLDLRDDFQVVTSVRPLTQIASNTAEYQTRGNTFRSSGGMFDLPKEMDYLETVEILFLAYS